MLRLLSISIVTLGLLFSVPAAAEETNFSGCYLGAGAGTHFINSDVEGEATLSRQGYLFEGSLGCRKQTESNLVVGAFVYGGFSNAEGETLTGSFTGEFGADNYYGLGIELGLAMGKLLPHVRVAYEQQYDSGPVHLGDLDNVRLDLGADYQINNKILLGLLLSTGFSETDVGSFEINTQDFKGLVTAKYKFN